MYVFYICSDFKISFSPKRFHPLTAPLSVFFIRPLSELLEERELPSEFGLLIFILSCFSGLTVTRLSDVVISPRIPDVLLRIQTKRAIAARWMPTYKTL